MACVILQTLLFFIHQANSSASSASASRVAVQLQEDLLRVQGNFAQQSKHKIFGGNSKETCRLPQRAQSVVQRLVLPLEIGAKLNAKLKLNFVLLFWALTPNLCVSMKNLSVILQKWRVNGSKCMLHRVVQPLEEPVPLLIPLMQNLRVLLNELSLLVHNSSNSKSCSRKIWSVRSEQKRL